MSANSIILRKVTGLLLICIFAFSITPVHFLHNLLADHRDYTIRHNHKKTSEVAKAGIDCHAENFVAERNFITTFQHFEGQISAATNVLCSIHVTNFYSQHHFYAELRGPPISIKSGC